MNNTNKPLLATLLFALTLLLSFLLSPGLCAQVLLQENFDAAALGTPPAGWSSVGNSGNVDPGQSCSGNAFRMNQFVNAANNNLDTPDLPRGTTPGNVALSFDMRLADWNDNSQLTGTGRVFVQLFIDGNFSQDFLVVNPVSFTNGCVTQTASFSTADIPLGADFKIRFLGLWSSGDWSLVIDNVDIRIVNDECSQAILLPQTTVPAGILDGNVVDGSLQGATQSQAGCTGTANDDVWYKFIATQRSVSVSVGSGTLDIVVELFSGNCGSLSSLRCVDNSTINEFFDHHGVNVGETYYVRAYSFGGTALMGTDANIQIQIGTPRSVNNECVSAEIITQSAATSCGTNFTLGTVENATESQTRCTGTANDDVWYQFEATSTDFSVYLESEDFVVQLFEGSCGGLTSLVCGDAYGIDESFAYTGATIGATYFLRVHSFGSTPLTGTAAEFGICVFTTAPTPDNNSCADAEMLQVAPGEACSVGAVSGTTNGATLTAATPRCSGINGNGDVWYSFTATAAEHFVTLSGIDILNGDDGDRASFEVFEDDCGARTRVQCSGQLFGTNPAPVTVNGLTPGTTYLIRVIPINPPDVIDFNICVTTACPDAPSDLAVNNTGTTTADLSHSYPFGIQRTHVVVLPGGDPVNAAVFSLQSLQSNATASGLMPNTDYEYFVLETCGGSTTAIGPRAFTTCQQLATGLSVTNVTATTARLELAIGGTERDFYVMPAGQAPVFGDATGVVFFTTSNSNSVTATGLTSNTAYDFYVGQACPETFAGPISFTTRPSCGDVIYDSGGPTGNYADDEDYTVTICPETADQSNGARRISLTFDEFDAENAFDGITIFDGPDITSPVITSPGSGTNLWSWDRQTNVGSGDLQGVTIFTLNASGCITIGFTSDDSVTRPGFKATVNCDLTAELFSTILTTVPAGSGAVTADRAYLSTASSYTYYVKEGTGSLLALKLGDTQAQVPISGVSMVAGSGVSNLGLNGCAAPYVTVPDWWVMNRTWDVAPSIAPSFPVGVRFFYTQADFDAIVSNDGFADLTHEELSFYKINGGDEEDLTVVGNACHDMVSPANYQEFNQEEFTYTDLTGSSLGSTAHQVEFNVTSFSGGGGGASTNFGGALPVEFLTFSGEAGAKFNHLSWSTAREENTQNHTVERSIDGAVWTAIGSLPAAGNSEATSNYEYTDEQPLSTALYRIRTNDVDGSFAYSSIIELHREQEAEAKVGTAYPNPAVDEVFLPYFAEQEDGAVELTILDGSGHRLLHQTITVEPGRNDLKVSLGNYPTGLYWLSVTTTNGERYLRRMVKQ